MIRTPRDGRWPGWPRWPGSLYFSINILIKLGFSIGVESSRAIWATQRNRHAARAITGTDIGTLQLHGPKPAANHSCSLLRVCAAGGQTSGKDRGADAPDAILGPVWGRGRKVNKQTHRRNRNDYN